MFYACILQGTTDLTQFYREHSADLKKRLAKHGAGKCPHTSKHTPWRIKFYATFETLELAQHFEKFS